MDWRSGTISLPHNKAADSLRRFVEDAPRVVMSAGRAPGGLAVRRQERVSGFGPGLANH